MYHKMQLFRMLSTIIHNFPGKYPKTFFKSAILYLLITINNWIENVLIITIIIIYIFFLGNINLHLLSPKCLRKRYVCSDHFNDCMYMNLNVEKRRLIQNAIPIKYTEQPTAHFNGNI